MYYFGNVKSTKDSNKGLPRSDLCYRKITWASVKRMNFGDSLKFNLVSLGCGTDVKNDNFVSILQFILTL